MAETTLLELLKNVSLRYGSVYASVTTTSAGTTTTFVSTSLVGRDELGGAQRAVIAGVDYQLTEFDSATGTGTFQPAASSAIASGATVTILPQPRQTMLWAINDGISAMGDSWRALKMVDDYFTLSPLVQSYTLPADCIEVSELLINTRMGIGSVKRYVPHIDFDVISQGSGQPKLLQMRSDWGGIIGYANGTRLLYYANPNKLSNDTDTLGIGELDEREAVYFVELMATAFLIEKDVQYNPVTQSSRAQKSKDQTLKAEAEQIRANRKRTQQPARVRSSPRRTQI